MAPKRSLWHPKEPYDTQKSLRKSSINELPAAAYQVLRSSLLLVRYSSINVLPAAAYQVLAATLIDE